MAQPCGFTDFRYTQKGVSLYTKRSKIGGSLYTKRSWLVQFRYTQKGVSQYTKRSFVIHKKEFPKHKMTLFRPFNKFISYTKRSFAIHKKES